MKPVCAIVAGLALALLCGCDDKPPTPIASATPAMSSPARHPLPAPRLVARAQGVAIAMPADMQLRRDFRRHYLASDAWRTFTAPGSHGTPIPTLVLGGSSAVRAAELRIGSHRQAPALKQCEDVPPNALPHTIDRVGLDGVSLRHFSAGDAAMSHYLRVDACRDVHAGRCYAIDLLLTGTDPAVHDPPRTPPFGRGQATARLQRHWPDGAWTRPAEIAGDQAAGFTGRTRWPSRMRSSG